MSLIVGKLLLDVENKLKYNTYIAFNRIAKAETLKEKELALSDYKDKLLIYMSLSFLYGTLIAGLTMPVKKRKVYFSEPFEEMEIKIIFLAKDYWNLITKLQSRNKEKIDYETALNLYFRPHKEALRVLEDYTVELANVESEAILQEVTRAVSEGISQGLSEREMQKLLKKRFKTFKKKRVVAISRTEATRAFNAGNLRSSVDVVQYYRFNAVLDSRTTTICKTRNGKYLKVSDSTLLAMNTPPLHVNCRSFLIPEFEAKGEFISLQDPEPQKRSNDVKLIAEILQAR